MGDGDAAWVVGVTVVPACEVCTSVRCGADVDGGAFGIGTAARHGAQLGIVGQHVNGVLRCTVEVEQSLVVGVARYGDVTRVAGDAIAPAEEDVVVVGRGGEYSSATVVVCASTSHAAALHRVALGGDFILQWREDGGIGGVAFHEYAAWVVHDAIVPHAVDIASVAVCGQMYRGAIVIGAASVDRSRTIWRDFGLDEALLDAKMGSEGDVLFDDDGARVVVVAVVPAVKLEAEVGRGRNLYGVAIIIGATTCHRAPCGMIAHNGDGVLQCAKHGGEEAVLGDDDGARVIGDAVVPAIEGKARIGRGRNLYGVAIVIGAAACHRTPFGMVGDDFNGVLQCAEMGDEGAVLGDDDGAWVVHVAVAPSEEGVACVGDGLDGDGPAIRIAAAARGGAPTCTVGFDGDGE